MEFAANIAIDNRIKFYRRDSSTNCYQFISETFCFMKEIEPNALAGACQIVYDDVKLII
ncbi:conserved hypothetical protein [Ricinus communis]|uniref:Uncharacterized protein n=1 Tax=Ricinus communis TaxID=3988 RepID=B9SAL3_RICCO|nr:conserved hypothetical protein [Ricinus communis]